MTTQRIVAVILVFLLVAPLAVSGRPEAAPAPPGRGRIRDVRLTTARGAPLICPIVLALVAGAHGTEYASVIALERLIGQLDPARLSGTVIIVPLVNLASFGQKVAHVNPIDGKSMNRMYLGTMDGTQTDRCGSAGCSP
ncbi:MAG: Succinylglutamate desuccinylase/aspartoacylase [candidate division NC10 bacterium]|nr:Succinylglutamate desuccinylase/aspartoacylase [candidate division NC10 bacterium]